MIEVQTSRPYVKIEGDKYYVEPAQARIAERLMASPGAVPMTYLMTAGKCPRGSAYVYISRLRSLLREYGYEIAHVGNDSYTLTKA